MLIEKNYRDFCDEETENELVKLGFPIEHACLQGSGIYVTIHISLYEAQKWLREEKGIFVMIEAPWKTDDGLGWSHICCNKPLTEEDQEVCFATGGFFDSYEEALLEGIKQAIYILKEE